MATKVRVKDDAMVVHTGEQPSTFRGKEGIATGQTPWSDYEVVVFIDGANAGFYWHELELL